MMIFIFALKTDGKRKTSMTRGERERETNTIVILASLNAFKHDKKREKV